MNREIRFKTAVFGGYNKDDVDDQISKLLYEAKGEANELARKLEKQEAAKEEMEKELRQQLSKKEVECSRLRTLVELSQKEQASMEKELERIKAESAGLEADYHKYKEDYLSISKQLVDAQKRADQMLTEAAARQKELTARTEKELLKKKEKVNREIEDCINEGETQYEKLHIKMQEILSIMNNTQARFLNAYKDMQRVIESAPDQLYFLDDEEELD